MSLADAEPREDVIEQVIGRPPARNLVKSRLCLLKISENKFLGKVSSAHSNGVMRANQGVVCELHQADVPQITDRWAIPRRFNIQRRCQTVSKSVETGTGLCRNRKILVRAM
jgi:hypothetical protein